MSKQKERVAVIGASPKEERYSNQCVALLLEYGYEVLPVHPAVKIIHGQSVIPQVSNLEPPIDTVTLYVSSNISDTLTDDLLTLNPRRIIFNPGTENPALRTTMEQAGIACEEACTLVLLKTEQF